jgi:hypothetical protein
MKTIEKEDVLVPLLEKSYTEENFYKSFDFLAKKGGELCLSNSFGTSLIIINIIQLNSINRIINILKDNKLNFENTIDGRLDEMDNGLFEKNSVYRFKRYVFKCKEKLIMDFKDKDGKDVVFSLFGRESSIGFY